MATRLIALPATDTLDLLEVELRMQGCTIIERTADGYRGTVTVKKRPSVIVALVIAVFTFWLAFIPVIVYLIAASKMIVEPFDVLVTDTPGGASIRYGANGKAHGPVERAVFALDAGVTNVR